MEVEVSERIVGKAPYMGRMRSSFSLSPPCFLERCCDGASPAARLDHMEGGGAGSGDDGFEC